MKKLFILTTLLLTLGLTGCNKVEANEVTENVELTMDGEVYDPEIHVSQQKFAEETFDELKQETMEAILAEDSDDISDDCRNELVQLVQNLTYDESYMYGYDVEQLQIDFVNILVKYDILPEICEGLTLDEIEELDENEF